MLSDEEKVEIKAELAEYPRAQGAIPEALKVVQRHRGWVSDESVSDLAEFLGLAPAEVDSIATFYTVIYRQPVGRHVILVCDGIACWVVGYQSIRDYLCEKLGIKLGQTTADGRFTLLPTCCVGACDKAPVMMIDEELHVNLTPEKIDQILDKYE